MWQHHSLMWKDLFCGAGGGVVQLGLTGWHLSGSGPDNQSQHQTHRHCHWRFCRGKMLAVWEEMNKCQFQCHSTVAFSWITLLFGHWWAVWTPASCGIILMCSLLGSIYHLSPLPKNCPLSKGYSLSIPCLHLFYKGLFELLKHYGQWTRIARAPVSDLVGSQPEDPWSWVEWFNPKFPEQQQPGPDRSLVSGRHWLGRFRCSPQFTTIINPKTIPLNFYPPSVTPAHLSKHEVLSSVGLSLRCDPVTSNRVSSRVNQRKDSFSELQTCKLFYQHPSKKFAKKEASWMVWIIHTLITFSSSPIQNFSCLQVRLGSDCDWLDKFRCISN